MSLYRPPMEGLTYGDKDNKKGHRKGRAIVRHQLPAHSCAGIAGEAHYERTA